MYYIVSTSPIEDFFKDANSLENTKFFVLQTTRNKKSLLDELSFTVMFYWTYENAPLNVAVMSNNYYFSNVSDDINLFRIYRNNTSTIPHNCVYDDKHPPLPKDKRLCADFKPIENKLSELVKSNLKEKGICSCVIA
jgi:hypothetical protein